MKTPPVVGDRQVVVAVLAAWVFRDEAQSDKHVPDFFICPEAGVGNNTAERLVLGPVVGLLWWNALHLKTTVKQ